MWILFMIFFSIWHHFNEGEDKPPTDPLQLHVEQYLAMKNNNPAPELAPNPTPPSYQGQHGPISIAHLLNPAPNVNMKGKSKVSKKGKKVCNQISQVMATLTWPWSQDFKFQFNLNTMNPNKDNEMV